MTSRGPLTVCLNGDVVRDVVTQLRHLEQTEHRTELRDLAGRLEVALTRVTADALLILAQESASIAQLRAVHQVLAHRAEQDDQHGGPDHDDTHGIREWLYFIADQVEKANTESVDQDGRPDPAGGFYNPRAVRARFMKIAALAIAAMESLDRRGLAR